MAKTRWVDAISNVLSGVTKPRSTARAPSISSDASTTSTSPGTGIKASTGSRPAACAATLGEQLEIVDRRAGALGDPGHRRRLREIAAVVGEIDDPVRQHAAAFAAERNHGDGNRSHLGGLPVHRRGQVAAPEADARFAAESADAISSGRASMRRCSQPITALRT